MTAYRGGHRQAYSEECIGASATEMRNEYFSARQDAPYKTKAKTPEHEKAWGVRK